MAECWLEGKGSWAMADLRIRQGPEDRLTRFPALHSAGASW